VSSRVKEEVSDGWTVNVEARMVLCRRKYVPEVCVWRMTGEYSPKVWTCRTNDLQSFKVAESVYAFC